MLSILNLKSKFYHSLRDLSFSSRGDVSQNRLSMANDKLAHLKSVQECGENTSVPFSHIHSIIIKTSGICACRAKCMSLRSTK